MDPRHEAVRRTCPSSVPLFLAAGLLVIHAAPANAQPTVTKTAERDPRRLEVGVVPILMGDSDLGFGFGGALSLARFSPDYSPFRWQLMAMSLLTLKSDAQHGLENTFQSHLLRLDLPDLAGGRLRLLTDLSFGRRSNSGYYGIGNAASPIGGDPHLHEYDRICSELDLRALVRLAGPLSLLVGGSLSYSWMGVYPGSKLEQDIQSNDALLGKMLHGTSDHLDGTLDVGLLWDTRDSEIAPSRGFFHELSLRFTPDPVSDTSYAGATLALRAYVPLYRDRLVFAARVLGDVLVGDPPIYELARYGGLNAMPGPGGGAGIRGVPGELYHSKIKLISNWELRGRLLPFTVFKQHFILGAIAFFDAGRVWSDFSAPSRFDGTGIGLKYGVGGGLRLQWGEAFLLRMDIAWSPDSSPIALYFNVNHVF